MVSVDLAELIQQWRQKAHEILTKRFGLKKKPTRVVVVSQFVDQLINLLRTILGQTKR